MIFHRAEPGLAPIDIAPGAPARLRLRPLPGVQEASHPTHGPAVEAYASRAGAAPADHGAAPAGALARAYADRDAAAEEAEYLREQLRSTQAYLAHLLEAERAAGRAECASLLGELDLLDAELRSRA